jgi:tRNA1Val (adenine37-N6)-methyltransferase
MSPEKVRRKRNEHFTFKQFRVNQAGCAMKVSSDACIFGAFVAVKDAQRILDIGTGTGLLSLMIAQRATALKTLDAVEIDPVAARVAQQNVDASPFRDRIKVIPCSLQEFLRRNLASPHPYDTIVSNPPFYQNSLRPKLSEKSLAWHAGEEGLDFKTLLTSVDHLLHKEGYFWVLLPADVTAHFMQLAAQDYKLFETQRLEVRHKPLSKVYRTISCLGRPSGIFQKQELIRCSEDGSVSPQEYDLLRDYMLHYL